MPLLVQVEVVQHLVQPLHVLVVLVLDVCDLRLVPHHQLLGLGLTLLEVVVAVFLHLLEQGTDGGLLLLAEGLEAQFHHIVVCQFLLPLLPHFHLLDLQLHPRCQLILLYLHQVPTSPHPYLSFVCNSSIYFE